MNDVTLRARIEAEVSTARAGIQAVEADLGKLATATKDASAAGKALGPSLMIPAPVALATMAPTLNDIRSALDRQARSATALASAQTALGTAASGAAVDMVKLAGVSTTVDQATQDEVAAMVRLSQEIDGLRMKVAPAITAEQMLAAAHAQVEAAVKAGLITQKEANLIADQARAKFIGLTPQLQNVEKGAFAAAGGTRMLGQQLSQVVQQGAATGNWLQALAIQLPDIAMGFGNIAIVASIVATVALPLIINAFGGGKSAAERATEANKAYADSFSVLEQDMSAATSLHAEYVAAVQSGNGEIIAAIQSEAKARAAVMKLDELDVKEKEKAAREAGDAIQVQKQQAEAALAQRRAQLDELQEAQKRQQAAIAAGDMDYNSADYAAAIELVQGKLEAETAELERQKAALAKNSAEYDVIQAKLEVLHAKQKANSDIMKEIADGTLPIISGLDGATASAGALGDALETALGVAQSLEATINNMNISNIGKAAELAALKAGDDPRSAKAAGSIAEKRAQLAPMLQSPEWDVRQLAAEDLRNFIESTNASTASDKELAERISKWNKDHSSSGGGAGKSKQGSVVDLSADARKALSDLDAQVAAINDKVRAGLMSTAEGAKAIDEARLKANDDLGLIIAKLEQMGPAGAKAAQELKKHLLSATDVMAQSVADFSKTMADGLKSPIEEFIKGTMSGKEAMASFGDFIIATLARIAAEQAVTNFFEPLMNSLFSSMGIPGLPAPATAGGGSAPQRAMSAPSPRLDNGMAALSRSVSKTVGQGAAPAAALPSAPGAASGAAPQISLTVMTPPGHTGHVQQRSENGGLQLEVMVEAIEGRIAGNLRAGRGSLNGAITETYALPRATR